MGTYNTVQPQFFQNREVFAHPPPQTNFHVQPNIQQPATPSLFSQPPPPIMNQPYNPPMQSIPQYQISNNASQPQTMLPQCVVPVNNQQIPYSNFCNQYGGYQQAPSVNYQPPLQPSFQPRQNVDFRPPGPQRSVNVKMNNSRNGEFMHKRRLMHKNFDNQKKKKKRTVDGSNLHEIKIKEQPSASFVVDVSIFNVSVSCLKTW